MKRKNHLWTILLIVIVAGLLAIILNDRKYINRLEMQIIDRDSLISKLAISEELVQEFFDFKQDSLTNEYVYTLKSSKEEPIQIRYRNQEVTYKAGDEILGSTELVDRYNTLLGDFNKLINEYNGLIKLYNELVVINNNWSGDRSYSNALKSVLDLIEKEYDIKYDIITDSTTYKIVLHPSPKIDSALVLLPYFRDNLKMDKELGAWIVTRTMIVERDNE